MYFVHSYEFIPNDKNVISATTDYSSNIVCSVEKEKIFLEPNFTLKRVIRLDLK